MSKEKQTKEVVLPLITTFCQSHPNCCMEGKTCPGTFTMNSKGQTALYRCGCMWFWKQKNIFKSFLVLANSFHFNLWRERKGVENVVY